MENQEQLVIDQQVWARLVILFLCISSVFTCGQDNQWIDEITDGKTAIEKGVEILVKNGAEPAKIYFRDLYRRIGNEEAAFYLAWSHYRTGEVQASEEINDAILLQTNNAWIKGKCWYLRGLISYTNGHYEQTKSHLKRALAEQLDQGDPPKDQDQALKAGDNDPPPPKPTPLSD